MHFGPVDIDISCIIVIYLFNIFFLIVLMAVHEYPLLKAASFSLSSACSCPTELTHRLSQRINTTRVNLSIVKPTDLAFRFDDRSIAFPYCLLGMQTDTFKCRIKGWLWRFLTCVEVRDNLNFHDCMHCHIFIQIDWSQTVPESAWKVFIQIVQSLIFFAFWYTLLGLFFKNVICTMLVKVIKRIF